MKIIDSHAHLMDELFNDDLNEVIKRCIENDIEKLVNIGYDKKSSYKAVELANEYDWMYAAIGLHPEECNVEDIEVDFIKELAKSQQVVAIGEIGLDYHYDNTDRENQQKGFVKQIQLANELSLPVTIHSRDADMDTLKVLKENKIEDGFVMHCFSSSVEVAKEILKLGGYISLAGTITFKNAKNPKEVAKVIPMDRLLIETDSPYLTPEPYRGQRNEPWHVIEIAKMIAEIKGIPVEDLINHTNENIKAFYRI